MKLTIQEIADLKEGRKTLEEIEKCHLNKKEKKISELRKTVLKQITTWDNNKKELLNLIKDGEKLLVDEEGRPRPFYDDFKKDFDDLKHYIPIFDKETKDVKRILKSLNLQDVNNFENLTYAQQVKVLNKMNDAIKISATIRDKNPEDWPEDGPLYKHYSNCGKIKANCHDLGINYHRHPELQKFCNQMDKDLWEYSDKLGGINWRLEEMVEDKKKLMKKE